MFRFSNFSYFFIIIFRGLYQEDQITNKVKYKRMTYALNEAIKRALIESSKF